MITTLHDTFVQGALGPQRRELTRRQAAPAGVLKVLKKGVRGQGAVLVEAWAPWSTLTGAGKEHQQETQGHDFLEEPLI